MVQLVSDCDALNRDLGYVAIQNYKCVNKHIEAESEFGERDQILSCRPLTLQRSTMAGFLCICVEDSLAPVLPSANGSSLLTWTDRRYVPRADGGARRWGNSWEQGLHSTYTFKNLSLEHGI